MIEEFFMAETIQTERIEQKTNYDLINIKTLQSLLIGNGVEVDESVMLRIIEDEFNLEEREDFNDLLNYVLMNLAFTDRQIQKKINDICEHSDVKLEGVLKGMRGENDDVEIVEKISTSGLVWAGSGIDEKLRIMNTWFLKKARVKNLATQYSAHYKKLLLYIDFCNKFVNVLSPHLQIKNGHNYARNDSSSISALEVDTNGKLPFCTIEDIAEDEQAVSQLVNIISSDNNLKMEFYLLYKLYYFIMNGEDLGSIFIKQDIDQPIRNLLGYYLQRDSDFVDKNICNKISIFFAQFLAQQ